MTATRLPLLELPCTPSRVATGCVLGKGFPDAVFAQQTRFHSRSEGSASDASLATSSAGSLLPMLCSGKATTPEGTSRGWRCLPNDPSVQLRALRKRAARPRCRQLQRLCSAAFRSGFHDTSGGAGSPQGRTLPCTSQRPFGWRHLSNEDVRRNVQSLVQPPDHH